MEAPQNLNIELQKTFSVSKDRLYESWINPEDLKQWWKPLQSKLVDVENDVVIGGKIKYTFDTEQEKNPIVITGDYLEVKENEKLIYNWNWETGSSSLGAGNYKLTITFSDDDQGSAIAVKQESTIADESLVPHREGWERSLNDLSTYLEAGNSTESDSIDHNDSTLSDGNEKTDGAGYNELPDQEKVGG
jgi:uncharacterized protein YndB with AHSA1/START domain